MGDAAVEGIVGSASVRWNFRKMKGTKRSLAYPMGGPRMPYLNILAHLVKNTSTLVNVTKNT